MGEVTKPKLLKRGAEASLFVTAWHGKKVVVKTRLPKKYRSEKLDKAIRTYRTVHEPQLMHEAKRAGVPTPIIFLVDVEKAVIVMEYIKGRQVKKLLETLPAKERNDVCRQIGELIGRLHGHGVIHGDLTTSNMILTGTGKIVLVDFGLGEKNVELEAKGVDLHLLKRALQSTHYGFAEDCFKAVMQGYAPVVGEAGAKDVLDKISEIERRGRYVAERKQEAEKDVSI
jgi:TP53 regulating kinase-like protein